MTPSPPPTPTALQVAVTITRKVSEPDQTTVIDWNVGVKNNGVGVNTAIVTIAGLSVPRKIGFIDGDYWLTTRRTRSTPPAWPPTSPGRTTR